MEMETTLKRGRSGSVSSGSPSPQIKKIRCEESDGEKNDIVLQNRVGCDTVQDKVFGHDDIDWKHEGVSLFLETSSEDNSQSPVKIKPSVSQDYHQIRDKALQMNVTKTEVFQKHTNQEEKCASNTLNLEKCSPQKNNSLSNNEKLFTFPLAEVHGDFVRNIASALSHNGAENVVHSPHQEFCETPLVDPRSDTMPCVQSSSVELEYTFGKLDEGNASKEMVLKTKLCNQKMISENCSHDNKPEMKSKAKDSILQPALDSCNVMHPNDINAPSQLTDKKETSPKYASGTDEGKSLEESFFRKENKTQNLNLVQLGKEQTKMSSNFDSVNEKQNSKTKKNLSSNSLMKASSDSSSEDGEPLRKSGFKKTEDKKKVLMSSDSESEDNWPLKEIILPKETVDKKQNSKPPKILSSKSFTKASSDSSSEDGEPLRKSGSKKTEDKKKVLMSSDSESEDNRPLKKIILPKDTAEKKQNSKPQKKLSSKSVMKARSDSSSDDEELLRKSGSKKTEDKKKVLMSSDSESEDNRPLKKKILPKDTAEKKRNSKPQKKLSSKSFTKASSDCSLEDEELLRKSGSKKTEDTKKVLMSSDSESEDNQPLKKIILPKDTVEKKQNSKPQKKLSSKSVMKASSDSSSEDEEPFCQSGSNKTEDNKEHLNNLDSENNQPLKTHVSKKETQKKSQYPSKERKASIKKSLNAFGMSHSSSEDDKPLFKVISKTMSKSKGNSVKYDGLASKNVSNLNIIEGNSKNVKELKKVVSVKKTKIKVTKSDKKKKLPMSNCVPNSRSSDTSPDEVPLKKLSSHLSSKQKRECANSDSSDNASHDDKPLQKSVSASKMVSKLHSSTKKGELSNIRSRSISFKSKSRDSDSDEGKPLKEIVPEVSDDSSSNSISDSQSKSDSDNGELLHTSSLKKKNKNRNHDFMKEETVENMSSNDSEESETEDSITQEKEKISDDDKPLKQRDSDSEPSLDSEPEESKVKEKKGVKAKSEKTEDPHKHHTIVGLKKYLRAAGIRVANYDMLWEGCKSIKDRASKLKLLLKKAGIDGRPSLTKCKKLKEAQETERELSELSLNTILTEARRSQRKNNVAEHSKELFSRIKAVFNSDSESE